VSGRSFRWSLGVLAASLLLVSSIFAGGKDLFRTHAVDVGTGLGIFLEIPAAKSGERPTRIVYDTGKGASEGLDNDLVSYLTAPEIGLKPAQGDFQGDVIDYFIISHPHEDHYNGSRPIFDVFDVRNVIESKQSHSIKYLKRFKAPAISEIYRAKAEGKDAHFYVVALPYPNGFDRPREGKPYDEYALAEKYLPAFMKGKIDPRKFQGKVHFPFGPQQVSQTIDWPVRLLMGESEKGMRYVPEELREASLEIDILPVGTYFDLGGKEKAGFTVVHADTIAGLDHANHESRTYKEAWPYYGEADVNDGSVSIQVTYGRASVFIPGDTEGRSKKPTRRFTLKAIFGSGEGNEAYTKEDVENHLRRNLPKDQQLPILPIAEPYVIGAKDLLRLAFHSYVTFDQISPLNFEGKFAGSPLAIVGKVFQSPEDIDPRIIYWNQRNDVEKAHLHPRWRERLFALHQTLIHNNQKAKGLRSRFAGWLRGAKPRLVWDQKLRRFIPDMEAEVWTITNLVQLTERIYYVDPFLAHLLAGFIMRSEPFLEYVAPQAKDKWTLRGEKHMIAVAQQVKAETRAKGKEVDILRSDVLFFGHHGSFTSSSLGFVLAVDPNVGIISADDKSYSGSTLPDFSALFWNLNTHHPESRALLHSAFFHADLLALRRGEPVDGYAHRNRFSQSAAKIFRARRRWPIPIWRTDFNDDLVDRNTLVDNILIESDGSRPIWAWTRRDRNRDKAAPPFIPEDAGGLENMAKYQYWFQQVGFNSAEKQETIRPYDPSDEIHSFQVLNRLPVEIDRFENEDDDEPEDWTQVDDH
jgi:beta-lactamase superfamily II metal-dependent hydrolase